MTDRMKAVRESFAEQAGPRVRVFGGCYTWGWSFSGDGELSFQISVDGNSAKPHHVLVEDGADLVAVAAAWGAHFRTQIASVPVSAPALANSA